MDGSNQGYAKPQARAFTLGYTSAHQTSNLPSTSFIAHSSRPLQTSPTLSIASHYPNDPNAKRKPDSTLWQAACVLFLLAIPLLITTSSLLHRSHRITTPIALQPQTDDSDIAFISQNDSLHEKDSFELDLTLPDLSIIEWESMLHGHGMQLSSESDIRAARRDLLVKSLGEAALTDSDNGCISLIAACANHWMHLSMTIQSWMKVKGVGEVVFVDWSTGQYSTRVARLFGGESVFIIHANQSEWHLTRAYNLAASMASCPKLLKVDCDTMLSPSFLERHPLGALRDAYYTMSWSESPNERKLAGSFYTHKRLFDAVHGYDERIDSYGYEDLDLYRRLEVAEAVRLEYEADSIHHIPFEEEHFDVLQSNNQTKKVIFSPRFNIRRNHLLLKKVNSPWTTYVATDSGVVSKYAFRVEKESSFINIALAEELHRPKNLEALVGSEEYDRISNEARKIMLHDDCHIPWDLISQVSSERPMDEKSNVVHDSDLQLLTSVLDPDSPASRKLLIAVMPDSDAFAIMVALTWAVFMAMSRERLLVLVTPPALREVSLAELVDIERSRKRLLKSMGVDFRFVIANDWKCPTSVHECVENDTVYGELEELNMTAAPDLVVLNPERNSVIHFQPEYDAERNVESISKIERQVYSSFYPTKPLVKMIRKSGDMSETTVIFLSKNRPEKFFDVWLKDVVNNLMRIRASDGIPDSDKPFVLVCGANQTLINTAEAILTELNKVQLVQHPVISNDDNFRTETHYLQHQYMELELTMRSKRIYFDDYMPLEWKVLIKYSLAWRKFNAPSLPNDMRRQFSNLVRRDSALSKERIYHGYEFRAW
eukprot:CAMPEP_0182446132 /NCGR_PEP_ID=MMETSP1172-20130603/4007_1 /TAXON_ID=708627 /ORGANISM="Timspurckia oligopyrenoides, Strain CCMP3278" /LENGTH=826 /DNA_ID=CAMNT_0024642013 /DNA_START=28 /DNA_END=2508 /DNA_ORIENTATION=+